MITSTAGLAGGVFMLMDDSPRSPRRSGRFDDSRVAEDGSADLCLSWSARYCRGALAMSKVCQSYAHMVRKVEF